MSFCRRPAANWVWFDGDLDDTRRDEVRFITLTANLNLPRSSATSLFISFLFTLDTERGHVYEYNKAAGEAARLCGWEPRAAVRRAARVTDLPAGWEKCLGSADTRLNGSPLGKLVKGWQLFRSLVDYLRRPAYHDRPVILFLEWFEWVHLLPFALALASTAQRGSFYVWLVHRVEARQAGPVRVNELLTRWVAALVSGRLVHLTDSEVLMIEMSRPGRPVYLLPVPHTAHFAEKGAQPSGQPGVIVAWLPGQAMPEKGLETVRKLAATTGPEAASLQVLVSQSAQLTATPGACQIRLLPDVLPRSDYTAWMQRADLILLPYDPLLFRARTSGVFVEAIVAGKKAVVTDGTWMAQELRRYGLEPLILDWDSPTILADLLGVARATNLTGQLARMQAAYAEFHSVPGYARVIQRVFEETRR